MKNGNEYFETLFPEMSDSLLGGSALATMQDTLLNTVFDQSKKMIGNMVEFKELMMMYNCAMKTVKTKFDVLNTEFKVRHQRNPIKFIDTRLKRTTSILEKMERIDIPFSLENVEEHINDVAGIRVICSYLDDIYVIAEALTAQNDVTLIARKDYIANPKPNGYRSLHLIISIPVFFSEQIKHLKVEVQIRTIAMDFWASLEHQLKYKQENPNGEEIAAELKECSEIISDTDNRMLKIRKQIEVSSGEPTDEELLFEKLKKFDMPME